MADNMTHAEKQKRILLNAEIKSMLGPCMISFSIPLFIPGLTITLVAFSDETGFSKYGALHVIGIVILAVACALLVSGCVMRCACRSKVFPFMEVSPHHKVTTHEKPKKVLKRTLTRDKLPPLVHGPQPGGSSVLRDNGRINEILVNPHRIIDSGILESESEDEESSSEDESDIAPSQNTNTTGLPSNNFMSSPKRDIKPAATETKNGIVCADTKQDFERTEGNRDDQYGKTSLRIENEIESRKSNLICPSYTDVRLSDTEGRSKERLGGVSGTPPDELANHDAEPPVVKPVSGWVSRQSHDKMSRGSKISSETPSSYSSSEVADADDDDCDDVTLTSRNCSTVPEIADLEYRDDSVEVDRFNNVWRGDSQNSVEISSVLSQDEYSEESLSVLSKDQLEIAEPSGSRGRASSDSAMESGGDHSRALSQPHRYLHGGLIEEDMEGTAETEELTKHQKSR